MRQGDDNREKSDGAVTHSESEVRIACLQMEPVVGCLEANRTRSLEMIEQAAAQGANIVVLPELCNSGYVFESRSEAFDLAEEVPDGPTTKEWQKAASRFGMIIVAGVRRHMKWNRFRFELFDILAHRFFHFKRRLCDAASVAVQSSVV